MKRNPVQAASMIMLAGLVFGSTAPAAPPSQEHVRMLIDQIPATIWPKQRPVRPDDYPAEQQSLRADVAHFLKGRFRVSGDRLFVIPSDDGVLLSGGMFMLNGPSQFQEIQSEPALGQTAKVHHTADGQTGDENGKTFLTVGVTQTGTKIYTAIALHAVPGSTDQLIGYFQLEPLVPDPAEGL